MRVLFALGSSAAALALAVAAAATETPKPASPPPAPHSQPQPPRAAGQYGAPTAYRASPPGHGYSAQSRHMADCLATYPGYDPSRDRIVDANGATRRCEL
jgi:hypothetical protein